MEFAAISAVLVGTKIDDTANSTRQLVLVLCRLVELVCSPVVTPAIIAEMQDVMKEYLEGHFSFFS